MADAASVQALCDEATCSVCLGYFKEPVIVTCGHIFCQDCISQCWAEAGEDASCPQCREPCQRGSLRPSRQLASMVAAVKRFSLQQPKGADAPGGVCAKHQELLKLFCEDDRALICVVCDKAKEHRQHKVIPKEEAFEEYKCKIESDLKLLKEEKEKYLSAILKEQAEGAKLLEQTQRERENIVAEFEQLRKFLKEREEFLLAQLKDLDDQITDANNKYSSKYSDKISSIDSLIKELEEKQEQSADEFLQDIRDVLPRCEEKPWQDQKAFPPKLSKDIEKFSKSRTFFETVMKDFRERLLTGTESTTIPTGANPTFTFPKETDPIFPTVTNPPFTFPKETNPIFSPVIDLQFGFRTATNPTFTIPTVKNSTNHAVTIPTVWLAVDHTVMELVEQQRSQDSAFPQQNPAFSQQNSAFSQQNSPFSKWHPAFSQQNSAFSQQNSPFSKWHPAFSQENSPFSKWNPAFSQQNSAFSQQNSAFSQQNSASTPQSNPLHCWTYLMGTEKISSGSHSWEVDVCQERFWAVGVARESLRGGSDLQLPQGVWAMGRFPDGSLSAFTSRQLSLGPNPTRRVDILFHVKDMPRKVQVSLNYENGTVAFLDAHNHTTIYTFHGGFSGGKISYWLSMGK